MMERPSRPFNLWLLLVLAGPVLAEPGDREAGMEAFARRDFQTAYDRLNAAYSDDSTDKAVGARLFTSAIQLMSAGMRSGDHEKVAEIGQWAAGISVDHIPPDRGYLAGLLRGRALRAQKKDSEALSVLEESRSQWPHPTLAVEVGEIAYVQEDWSRAADAFRDYIDTSEEPAGPDIYIFLARSLDGGGDVPGALAACDEGLARYPGHEVLESWRKKFAREAAVEGTMDQTSTRHFAIHFEDDKELADVRKRVMEILEEAYSTVTGRFGVYPEQVTQVVLYSSKDQYLNGTGVADWSGGCFNGKMRIPLSATDLPDDELRRVLTHEFTHAMVSEIAGGNHVPGWLNEGLAQSLDGTTSAKMEDRLDSAGGRFIPLGSLNGSYGGLGGNVDTVRLAYAQAFSFTAYLETKFGAWKVQQLVQRFGEGLAPDEAIRYTLGHDLATHEKNWHSSRD